MAILADRFKQPQPHRTRLQGPRQNSSAGSQVPWTKNWAASLLGDVMSRPLAHLRGLELARILAGPWAGQRLAELGADVIKVERKGAGDDTRGWGPPFV